MARHFTDATNQAHAEHARRVDSLETRIAAAEQAKSRLLREIEVMPEDNDLAQAMRADIRERYYQQEGDRRALVMELDELKAQEPPPEDPSLLEELPLAPITLNGVPEDRQRDLFAALALAIRYNKYATRLRYPSP